METAGEGLLILIGTSGGNAGSPPAGPRLVVGPAPSAATTRGAELAVSPGLAPWPQAIKAANRRVAVPAAIAAFMLAQLSEPRIRRVGPRPTRRIAIHPLTATARPYKVAQLSQRILRLSSS